MNLEQQCADLELCKKLKTLGVKQNSLFYWEKCPAHNNKFTISCDDHHDQITGEFSDCHLLENQENYSAFTAGELSEFLPCSIDSWGLCIDATSSVTDNEIKNLWHITYAYYDKKLMDEVSSLNLANAMAKMLIILIKEGLMP